MGLGESYWRFFLSCKYKTLYFQQYWWNRHWCYILLHESSGFFMMSHIPYLYLCLLVWCVNLRHYPNQFFVSNTDTFRVSSLQIFIIFDQTTPFLKCWIRPCILTINITIQSILHQLWTTSCQIIKQQS